MMRISLIVAAEPDPFNHKQQNFFAPLAAQTYPSDSFELIFVDAHASDSTVHGFANLRRSHPEIAATLLHCASPARAIGNNLAAAHADGDLLVFLADDFDPSPGLLAAHAEYHALNRDLDAVGIGAGMFTDEIRQDPFARWLEDSGQIFGFPMRSVVAVWPTTYFYAGNASIKKAKFDALGGFNERFLNDAWDDFEFGLRWAASGGYSQCIANAFAMHRHAVSFEERCHTMETAGKAARVLEELHPALHHPWQTKIHQPRLAPPESFHENAPMHVRIAFYEHQLDAAFRRGYLGVE